VANRPLDLRQMMQDKDPAKVKRVTETVLASKKLTSRRCKPPTTANCNLTPMHFA